MGCCKSCQQQVSAQHIIKQDILSSKINHEQRTSDKHFKKEILLISNQSEDSCTFLNISQENQDIQIHDNVRNCSLPYQFQESTEIQYIQSQHQSNSQQSLQQQKNSPRKRIVIKNKKSQFYSPQIQKREPLFLNILDISFYGYDQKQKQQKMTSILKRETSKQNSQTNSSYKKVKFAKGTSFRSKSAIQQNKQTKNKQFRKVIQINQ